MNSYNKDFHYDYNYDCHDEDGNGDIDGCPQGMRESSRCLRGLRERFLLLVTVIVAVLVDIAVFDVISAGAVAMFRLVSDQYFPHRLFVKLLESLSSPHIIIVVVIIIIIT